MKIFLDTAQLDLIEKYSSSKLIDGVTTNPSNLSKEGDNPSERVRRICALFVHGQVSVEITEPDPKKAYDQAKKIAALGENVLVKIPCHTDYYAIIERLVNEQVPLNITLVFTVIQGLMMAKLGVQYISPFVGRWDDIDVDASTLLLQFRHMIDKHQYTTNILAASIRQVRQVHEAIIAGADAITLSPALFERVLKHPLTDNGRLAFEDDWQTLKIGNFPE